MVSKASKSRIDELLELINTRLAPEQASQASEFVKIYYAHVAAEDLAGRPIEELYGAALSHWHFANSWPGKEAKLRVYNARADEHGWQSTHTVIDIVNIDMPFLVDSISMEVNRLGLTLHLIVHPVMRIVRDSKHRIVRISGSHDPLKGGRLESLIHVEVDRRTEPAAIEELRNGLSLILAQVRLAVSDWKPMHDKLLEVANQRDESPPATAGDISEEVTFLRWVADHHFVILGYRDHDLLHSEQDGYMLRAVAGSGLGILRDKPIGRGTSGPVPGVSASFANLPADVRARASEPSLLLLTKSNNRAPVHRPGYMDYIGVKRFDDSGRVIGEQRFIGLYTSNAYRKSVNEIPILRRKAQAVASRTNFLPGSHAAKALVTILEQYPRDELFQIEEEELLDTATGILRLGERQRTRLFIRHDAFRRFVSCLIFVPRENYNTDLRTRIEELLLDAFDGKSSEFSVQFSDSPLARLWIVVRTPSAPRIDVSSLEQKIVFASRRWVDLLRDALLGAYGEERGSELFLRYASGMSAGYREAHTPGLAVRDIDQFEQLSPDNALGLNLYVPIGTEPGHLRFRLYHVGELAPLSHSLAMLELMGVVVLDERPFKIKRDNGKQIWIEDFGIAVPEDLEIDVDSLRVRFHDAFQRTWRGENESDPFNRLVLAAGLDWRSVTILRAYARFMKQATSTFSQSYVEQALASQPETTRALVELFLTRFDPEFSGNRDDAQEKQSAAILANLESVSNLDEDRILRQYLALIQATVRTNFFQRNAFDEPKLALSFKFESAKIPGLPEPKPLFEIFVYSPRFEGVHLRGGPVARGGLRWSDRREDFRTEVLQLAKAQQVKNAVIVPVGSKGGFVLKGPPQGDRDQLQAEGIACYQAYLRAMLDLTDNMVVGKVVPPPFVVRHDADDPYLVVAADKGTATFSDFANNVAQEYDYWLGDAFASGGSVGYDHKKMAITARGAWESVKRHFRSIGVDTQTQVFTVVGIGDMSGDVFGNGMLLSEHIQLIAAFDHRHIFIDPTPDTAVSFAERTRLFSLPRSSWADYDTQLLSKGGGVWPRTAKWISLSPEVKNALGIQASRMTPADLISAILKAPANLLYNGGIGTYVKSSKESHGDCGDRANDGIRVDAAELRCQVVAEGGNLGLTQLGRIEFALNGGLICTDAIDNSAGVDCSDHEVNIKILLNAVVTDGELTTKQRNRLLMAMTDEVAELVLKDNVDQNRILGLARHGAIEWLDEQVQFMRAMSSAGRLNRRIEYLPSDDEIAERRLNGIGLTTPEVAVLLAYAKMTLFEELLDSDLPGDPTVGTVLEEYFPKRLSAQFDGQMQRHPLRREIIATKVVNGMVNNVGPGFLHRISEETGAESSDIVRAYLAARDVFGLQAIWHDIEAPEHSIPMQAQYVMHMASVHLLGRAAKWFLRHQLALRSLAATIDRFTPGVAQISAQLNGWLNEQDRTALEARVNSLVDSGVPKLLAIKVSQLETLVSALDIVEVAAQTDDGIDSVAAAYFGISGRLNLGWIAQQIDQLSADSHWQRLAQVAVREELAGLARVIAQSVLEQDTSVQTGAGSRIENWTTQHGAQLARWDKLLSEMKSSPAVGKEMVPVMLWELRTMA
ncbi:MAG: NAD-glutamate dehydrogenase [Burkholderiaceae bacterium]